MDLGNESQMKILSILKKTHYVMITAWLARVIQAVTTVLILSIITSILNVTDYSAYILIVGLTAWFALADLGFGFVLQNKISECRADGRSYEKVIANVLFGGCAATLVISILVYFSSFFVTSIYFRAYISDGNDLRSEFVAAGIALVCATNFSIVYKIWYALGKGYMSNILPAIASLISYILLALIDYYEIKATLMQVLMIYLVPMGVLPAFFYIKILYRSRTKIEAPFEYLLMLFPNSKRFLMFALLSALVLNVDYLIASSFLTPEELIKYNVYMRIFSLAFFAYSAFLMAVWPVVSELISSKKSHLVLNTLRVPVFIGILFVAAFGVFVYCFGDVLLAFLIRNVDVGVDLIFIVLLCVYFMLRTWTDTFSMIMQSCNFTRPLLKIVPLQACISVFLQIVFSQLFGAKGILLGLVLSFVLTVAWYLPCCSNKLLKENQGHFL